ncbi:MAG: hypothetical protein WCD81_11145 [Candidatus Bathyarchaeia archaeon]
MTHQEKQGAEEPAGANAELESTKQLTATLDQLQKEVASLKSQLEATNRKSSSRIGIVFAVPGILSLAFSVITASQVLAFIGLGLTFWGALFLLVRPIAYVRGSLLGITAVTLYSTIDRIIKDLNYEGKGLYVPPYPRDAYLPEHLKGLKESIVFISADADSGPPSVEEIASSRFMTKKPRGICITAPGSGLVDQFEKMLRTDLTKMNLEDLCASLPQIILENFQLAKEIEMKTEDHRVILKTSDSVFKNLYLEEGPRSVRLLGCPLVSAVASALGKTTGKATLIESINTSPDVQTIEVSYGFKEG